MGPLPHTHGSESRPRRPFVECVCVCVCVCLGVGGVPHQLWWGGSKDSAAKSGGAAGYPLRGCWSSDCEEGIDAAGEWY